MIDPSCASRSVDEVCALACKIAKLRSRGLPYRDEVIADALLAVAQGVTDWLGIDRACQESIRREKRFIGRNRELLDEMRFRAGAPERVQPALWEALKALPERQYQVIMLTFWGGMTQEAIAAEMGVIHQAVSQLLSRGIKNLKNILGPHSKTRFPDAVYKYTAICASAPQPCCQNSHE